MRRTVTGHAAVSRARLHAVVSAANPPVTATAVPGARKAALAFIFVTVLIDILAFGLIIPVLPHLLRTSSAATPCMRAYWVGVFGFLFAAIQFVSAPVQGAMSDRFGRRPVILLSCLGLGVDFIFMAVAQTLPWLLVGRVISAIFSASFTTANAYIADVTEPAKRAQAFGMIGAAFGLGFIIGPAIGGHLGEVERAPALLVRRGPGAGELRLRLVRAARIAADRAPHQAHRLGARESARFAEAAWRSTRDLGPGGRGVPGQLRALRLSERVRAVRGLPRTAGARATWAGCSARSA